MWNENAIDRGCEYEMTDRFEVAGPDPTKFTPYQLSVAVILAFLQFAVILDFMIMAPLGAMIMPALNISPKQFGMAVSAYAFSAGITGLLTAGFADRFDRKKLLLFFYAGFMIGTLWCGLAQSFPMLLVARIVTGIFGGVIGSIILAIAADLFQPQLRGRVMGIIQMSFAGSQVLGLPIGLALSNHWTWHTPFLATAAIGVLGGLVVMMRLRPIAAHLAAGKPDNAFSHLINTVFELRYIVGFAATALLTTGGFLLMPFSSAFTVNNLGVAMEQLPTIYLITGLSTMVAMPLIGKVVDKVGKLPVFLAGSTLAVIMVQVYTHMAGVSFTTVVIVNVVLFVGLFARMVPYQALLTSVPDPTKRGSFNAINAAVQQLSGGVASLVAGHLISADADGKLQNFPLLGYILAGTAVITAGLVWRIQKDVQKRSPF